MKLRKLTAIFAVAALTLSLAACGNKGGDTSSSSSSEDTDTKSGDSFKIGFSNCSQDTPFFANMTPIIEDYAKSKGLEVVSLNADNDTTKQNKDIQDLISQGIDVLIINPVNEDGPTAGIEACNKNDIPVITVDKNVTKGNTAWVGRDNEVMGKLVGERLIELLGGEDATGTVLEIQGTAGSTTMMNRRDGFHAALENAPGLKIVQSSYCDYDRSKAIPATQDLLQANKDVVAIFGHNDDMAIGAAQVCKEQKMEDVLVCGVDGLMEAVLKIETGEYHITSSNDPVLLGQTAVDAAIQYMAGETLDEFIDAGTVVIDTENVAEYADKDLDFATMVK
ncbi:ribose transport system substrate-binding protein [Aequitasia blattaphilus]|uniref:Substrate-binding domain-containing protein n=1 Tax=Aequitasia blattaphilus TaxID=2949332 RepID=A0ABT1EDV7_9FIRM|nr:substrate-binding domain-containing protein [Aequitasia blattaphilus]MCP1102652.1 substrate-binding domain-containing protein [Aequitasia blattaphilus]MCR8615292.1 substrate-binding domain-containing protein [Aequitasia blattaphilus]